MCNKKKSNTYIKWTFLVWGPYKGIMYSRVVYAPSKTGLPRRKEKRERDEIQLQTYNHCITINIIWATYSYYVPIPNSSLHELLIKCCHHLYSSLVLFRGISYSLFVVLHRFEVCFFHLSSLIFFELILSD